MRKKFNKTLTFDWRESPPPSPSPPRSSTQPIESSLGTGAGGRQRRSVDMSAGAHPKQGRALDYAQQPGLAGTFVPIRNDFSILLGDTGDTARWNQAARSNTPSAPEPYRDEAHWTRETREQVKRVRFIICTLALLGLALGLMSRLIMNVSIVEMVRRPGAEEVTARDGVWASSSASPAALPNQFDGARDAEPALSLDPLIYAATEGLEFQSEASTTASPGPESSSSDNNNNNNNNNNNSRGGDLLQADDLLPAAHTAATAAADDDGLHFDWSSKDVNLVLGAFYIGYAPGILFSGGLAERYGAKWPLFVCIFGSALINLLTPTIARTGLGLLVGSRVLLGLVQGSLLPSLYELFNRWLTATEASIFAPLIKVSMPLGSLMGSLMPALVAWLALDWPILFQLGGLLCLLWALAWAVLAASLPQDSSLVSVNELHRIMRKKKVQVGASGPARRQVATLSDKSAAAAAAVVAAPAGSSTSGAGERQTPWLKIITSPSVLALTVVKFTYNIGMDFVFLQVAVYLRDVHGAPIETISAIASGGYCMQMLLIAFVGWLARVVVVRRALGLSVTKWRKVFQGGSNFLMALTYLALAQAQPSLNVAASLILLVCFFWMLGAGGESMVPYDLSSEYPASIVGFAHSVSIFSGITLTAACDLIQGEHFDEPADSWSLLFYLISGALALGGLIFVTFLKAKPFLPSERQPKLKQRVPRQQVASISRPAPQRKVSTGKLGNERAAGAAAVSKLNGFR